MYQVNLLENNNWREYGFCEEKSQLFKCLSNSLGKNQQILYNEHFLTNLDGTIYQLNWFMENHDRLLNQVNNNFSKVKR